MKKTHLNPDGIYKHPSFTRIISVEGPARFIFIAGQTSSDENYKCVGPGDMKAQYVQVMTNLQRQLEAAGATWDDVVYSRTFVLDVDEFFRVTRDPTTPKFRNPDRQPASTLVGVTRLSDPDFLIEVDLVAAVPASG
jgi:enamine deaminase RidA (YjgF/YER057c/UK114 family)